MENKYLPEAPISANTKIKSPNGFEYQITLRYGITEKDFADFMTLVAEKEAVLLKKGWSALPMHSSYNKQQKPKEYVQGRKCPKCQGGLIHATKKDGSKYIKCENNKWVNGAPVGCPFVEWPDAQQGGGY